MTTAAIPTPIPALAPVERPGEGEAAVLVEGEEEVDVDAIDEVGEDVVDVLVELGILVEKSFALYRIDTPYAFISSVEACRVASMTVNALPSVTVVVICFVNGEAQASPRKLNNVPP